MNESEHFKEQAPKIMDDFREVARLGMPNLLIEYDKTDEAIYLDNRLVMICPVMVETKTIATTTESPGFGVYTFKQVPSYSFDIQDDIEAEEFGTTTDIRQVVILALQAWVQERLT